MPICPPLKVHLCWSPNATEDSVAIGLALFEFLHRPAGDDPVLRPGLEIPVELGRDLRSLLDAIETQDEPPVDTRVVVVLLDGPAYEAPAFRTSFEAAKARWADATGTQVFVPLVLDSRWYDEQITGPLDQIAAVSVPRVSNSLDTRTRHWSLGADLAVVVGRALLRRDGQQGRRPRIFISHSKADMEATGRLAEGLRTDIATQTRLEVFFDANDVERGTTLRPQLEAALDDAVLLVVRTDGYSESPWCGLELLLGKTQRLPMVTVLSTQRGEPNASAYGGNHRTIQWRGPETTWEVIGRCVQVWLHRIYFPRHARVALRRSGLPADAIVFARRPELIDLALAERRAPLVVYPDPPMPEHEADALRAARPAIRLATPNTLFGRVLLDADPAPPLSDALVAYSLSDDTELPPADHPIVGLGITRGHLLDVLNTIVLATVLGGARIAYGGDLRPRGFGEILSRLLVSHRRLGRAGRPQLVMYLRGGQRPEGTGDVRYTPEDVATPAGAERYPDQQSILWHMAMRRRMAEAAHARVLLGGKAAPRSDACPGGYFGPWPGFLEEAWWAAEAGKALYVIGGFGGCAGLVAETLVTGEVPTAFRESRPEDEADFVRRVEAAAVARRALATDAEGRAAYLVREDGAVLGMEDFARGLRDRWQRFVGGDAQAWPNGLTAEENRTLFASTDPTEISHLVVRGLLRVTKRPSGELRWRRLRGDIGAVPDVAAYAVTMTPGVPPVGASASLDRRMDGRLALAVRESVDAEVVVADVGTASLAGSHVFVARLPLPQAGSGGVEANTVELLARLVAEAANRLGVHSIACAPFGTTLGLSTEEAVRAMMRGFKAGRGALPTSVTFCEPDARRYEALSAVLGSDTEELREGIGVPPADESSVLSLRTTPQASWIESTLYVPDAGPVVPAGRCDVDWSAEVAMDVSRVMTMDEVAALGTTMWSRLLPERVQKALAERVEQRVVLVTDEAASAAPWEYLTDPVSGGAPALRRGVVRRLALPDSNWRDALAKSGHGGRLRVLVVADPTSDLPGARDEGAIVRDTLAGRADTDVVLIERGDATRERLLQELGAGGWDVLHFAGHAFFDPVNRDASGILMAGAVVVTAADFGSAPAPLVVLGACESGCVRGAAAPRVRGAWSLAEGLLRNGVTALVGTFHPVSDRAARLFAERLYGRLAEGTTLGTAMCEARRVLYDANEPDWGNFILYGDDRLIL